MPIPLIPAVIGGAALLGVGGTTGYVLGVKTSNLMIGGGLMAAAYLVYKKAK